MSQTKYTVKLFITVEADSPEEAIHKAIKDYEWRHFHVQVNELHKVINEEVQDMKQWAKMQRALKLEDAIIEEDQEVTSQFIDSLLEEFPLVDWPQIGSFDPTNHNYTDLTNNETSNH